jgi:hypothetical protein
MTIYPNILWFVELFLKCQRTSCTDTIDESITPYCLDYTTSTRLYETQILFGKRQVSSHNMESVGENMLRGPARILHNETMVHNITGEDSHEHSTTSTDEDWFLMFLAVIVGMILLAYAFCVFQMVRVWCCHFCFGRNMALAETSIVHQGRVLYLNPGQRRAVLEAFFSENSKVRKDSEVMTPSMLF